MGGTCEKPEKLLEKLLLLPVVVTAAGSAAAAVVLMVAVSAVSVGIVVVAASFICMPSPSVTAVGTVLSCVGSPVGVKSSTLERFWMSPSSRRSSSYPPISGCFRLILAIMFMRSIVNAFAGWELGAEADGRRDCGMDGAVRRSDLSWWRRREG